MTALHISEPMPGTYRTRLKGRRWVDGKGWANHPWVPVLIQPPAPVTEDGEPIDRAEARAFVNWPPLVCLVDGEPRDAEQVWPYLEPITRAEFDYMTADAEWCRSYAPEQPRANPEQPIDLDTLPPIF